MVQAFELADAVAIRDNQTLEAPFLPQHLLQQPGVGVHRDAVDFVV